MPTLRNNAESLNLGWELKDADLEALLTEAEDSLRPDSAWYPGQKIKPRATEWILDGLIHKGYFHALFAPAKLGKTTLVLDFLFHLFSKQVGQYLDLSLNSDKNWQLYLIGPDMHVELWQKLLDSAGLLKEDGMLSDQVQVVRHEELADGLSASDIKRYARMADQATARGEEPIFLFDCYSAMITNTGKITASEISDLYYKPLRKLKNAMSATGATTILLHHSSKSSRGNGAVDAAAGNSGFSRIPDILIKLDWLKPHQDFDEGVDRRIVLNATGRIDPKALLIRRDEESGHFVKTGELSDAKRQATLNAVECSLNSDQSKACDFFGELANADRGTTVNEVAAQMNWSRHKSQRIIKRLVELGLVYNAGDTNDGSFSRPAQLWKHWKTRGAETMHEALGNVRSITEESGKVERRDFSDKPVMSDLSGNEAHTIKASYQMTRTPGFGNLAPGSKVDRKVGDEWDTGWIVKDSSGGMHTIWKYPNLNKFICNQRVDIEIRVSNGTTDGEEL